VTVCEIISNTTYFIKEREENEGRISPVFMMMLMMMMMMMMMI
jgi:hypothetical protein